MTPEPRPSPSLVVTLTVTTEGRAFAATAVAVVVLSSFGLMVMVWLTPVSKVAAPDLPMTPVARSAPVSRPAPMTPPATPKIRDLAPRCSRLGLGPEPSAGAGAATSPGLGAYPGCWPGIGGTEPAPHAERPASAAPLPASTRGC